MDGLNALTDIRAHLHDLSSELTGSGWRDIPPHEWTDEQRASYDRWAADQMRSDDGRQTLTDWWQTVRTGQTHGSILPVYSIDPRTGALTGCVIREYVGVDIEEV